MSPEGDLLVQRLGTYTAMLISHPHPYVRMGLIGLFLLAFMPVGISQTFSGEEESLKLLQQIREDDALSSGEKSFKFDSLFRAFGDEGDLCIQLWARSFQSGYLENLGLLDSALSVLYYADSAYTPDCGMDLMTSVYVNFTSSYLSYRYYEQVDSIASLVLRLADSLEVNDEDYLAIMTNLGISRIMQGDAIGSAEAFRKVLKKADEIGDLGHAEKSLVNLGALKGMTGDLDSAYYFLSLAAQRAKLGENEENYVNLLINMSNIHADKKEYAQAMALLDSAEAISPDKVSLETRGDIYDQMAFVYSVMGRYKVAYDTLRAYISMYKELLDQERMQAVAEMKEKYESERKARQIQQLQLEKLDQEVENQRIRNARNRLIFFGGAILIIAIALWSRLTLVRRSREELRKEKEVSDNLLLNILPSSVAEELKLTGKADAQYFDSAAILFSDFKNFTGLSEKLGANELVNAINMYFKEFDRISGKYGLEKIKTIGDSYMAAGGLPAGNTATVREVVRAGLEMQEFVLRMQEVAERDELKFEMRVGIHVGPIVAGIVGVKKFQYDLWGDTVNIASRMESSGEVDKVNISGAVYTQMKDDPSFQFESRGKVFAKGKGELEMYFVSKKS